jgi:hypothetical protein
MSRAALPSDPAWSHRTYAAVLGGLAFAFLLRVLGQALVAGGWAEFLPRMEQWYSGLIPYGPLLAIQVFMLAVQAAISRDIWRNSGRLAGRHPSLGRGLRWFSYVYFAAMLLRYTLTMALYPERRWLTGTIPIFFHCVLAAYLFTLGTYYSRRRSLAA